MSSDIETGEPSTPSSPATPTPGCNNNGGGRKRKGENCLLACFHKTKVNWKIVHFTMAASISLIILLFSIIALFVYKFDLPNSQQNVLWSLISAVIGLWFKHPSTTKRRKDRTNA